MAKKPKAKEIYEIKDGQLITAKADTPQALDKKRVRSFCCITYIHEEALIRFLKMSKWVQHWAICPHDKDLNVDGSPKQDHIHIVLYTYNAHSSSAIQKNFDRYSQQIYQYTDYDWQNTLVEECLNMVSQYRYLLHQDNPEKYQYNPIRRKSDSDFYWFNLENTSGLTSVIENKGMAIVQDIIDGVSERDLVARYGNAYIWHSLQYHQSARAIIRQESVVLSTNSDNTLIDLILNEDAPLSRELINNFYTVLDYVKAECIISYQSALNFYLQEKET